MSAVIATEELTKTYKDRTVVDSLALEIPKERSTDSSAPTVPANPRR